MSDDLDRVWLVSRKLTSFAWNNTKAIKKVGVMGGPPGFEPDTPLHGININASQVCTTAKKKKHISKIHWGRPRI
jgi:hypothetical protein